MIEFAGRYDLRDHGPDRPWSSAVVAADGAWMELRDRSDDERAALAGRAVRGRGHRDGDALVVTELRPDGALAYETTAPDTAAGRRVTVEVVETSLEMLGDDAPALSTLPQPAGTAVTRARTSVRYYRYLYDAVGAPWHWWNRKAWSDDDLATYLALPTIEVYVVSLDGCPVGYVELDRREAATCEIVYFGLVPEAHGLGLGRWFLTWAIHTAWSDRLTARLWVHTCTLDGPAALHTYRRLGFRAYASRRFTTHILAP